jgi:hypothetical protein
MSHRPLIKHTIVIWADAVYDSRDITHLAQAAESGDCYCSRHERRYVASPEADPDWDGTEFFGGEEGKDA